jgi:hypothetical protein
MTESMIGTKKYRLARARAGGDDEALAGLRLGDGLALMAVEAQRQAVGAKDLSGQGIDDAGGGQRVRRIADLVVRIDGEKRVRPKAASGVVPVQGVR